MTFFSSSENVQRNGRSSVSRLLDETQHKLKSYCRVHSKGDLYFTMFGGYIFRNQKKIIWIYIYRFKINSYTCENHATHPIIVCLSLPSENAFAVVSHKAILLARLLGRVGWIQRFEGLKKREENKNIPQFNTNSKKIKGQKDQPYISWIHKIFSKKKLDFNSSPPPHGDNGSTY